MQLSQNNFFAALRGIIMGGGKNASGKAYGDAGFWLDEYQTPSQMATTGTRATATNSLPADAVVMDADDEDVIVSFTVPRDYDEATDDLIYKLRARHVSGTSIALQPSAVSKMSATSDLAAVSGYTAPTAVTVNSAFDVGDIECDLSGLDLQRGDTVHINFVASATTGVGIAHVTGGQVVRRSTLVSYDREDSAGASLR